MDITKEQFIELYNQELQKQSKFNAELVLIIILAALWILFCICEYLKWIRRFCYIVTAAIIVVDGYNLINNILLMFILWSPAWIYFLIKQGVKILIEKLGIYKDTR